MQDIKPKRVERGSGPRKTSPVEAAPIATTPEFAAPITPAAPIVPAQPAASVEPRPEIAPPLAEPQTDSLTDPWAAFTEVQAVLARGVEEIAAEVSGISRSGIAAAVEATGALLGAKSFSEAVAINATLARSETDVMIEGLAKLAEIGVKALSELSQPFLSRSGARWSGEIVHG